MTLLKQYNNKNNLNNQNNNKIKPFKETKRSNKFKIYKKLYQENKKKLADLIWENKDDNIIDEKPNIVDIENEYKKIFEAPEKEYNDHYQQVDYGEDCSYMPITIEQLEVIVKSLKISAPGLDGVTVDQVKQMDIQNLSLLYNIILAKGIIPEMLRKCRTTLVPKGGDLKLIKNWRPITIGSIILRILNKIIAIRLNKLNLNHTQKGFRNIDGCMANLILIQNIIKSYRKSAKPYNIITIDLKKAFDTVTHKSINGALKRIGVNEKIRNLIDNQYKEVTTTITCANEKTNEIPVKRGVKQGDPLSSFIFNSILDEYLTNVKHELGVELNNIKISTIAYADDIIIVSENVRNAQQLINNLANSLEKKGLIINPAKCTALTALRVPAKKKLYIETNNVFKCKDDYIPQIKIEELFKYLGRNFGCMGIKKTNINETSKSLENLRKAPLKPPQKLNILKQFFIPKILYSFQYPGITNKTLKEVDQQIRKCVKGFLHLPSRTASEFLYARLRDGGIGLLSLRERIPLILYNRLKNLKKYNDPFTDAALLSTQGLKLETKLKKMMNGKENKTTIDRIHAGNLEKSYSGNGLIQGNWDSISSSWIDHPPSFWKGYDYVNAIKLRSNMLPTKGIPSNPIQERKCRGGCEKVESLSHVLQNCPVTHWKRINRHDRICKLIKDGARKKGFQVESEPNIRGNDGILKKPDIIIIKENQLTIIDVGIHWEGPNLLNSAYTNKKNKYSAPEFIDEVKKEYNIENLQILPFIMGARGTWCQKNQDLSDLIELNKNQKTIITADTLKGSIDIHKDFGTRVWVGNDARRRRHRLNVII